LVVEKAPIPVVPAPMRNFLVLDLPKEGGDLSAAPVPAPVLPPRPTEAAPEAAPAAKDGEAKPDEPANEGGGES
jgi:hypothetical protein